MIGSPGSESSNGGMIMLKYVLVLEGSYMLSEYLVKHASSYMSAPVLLALGFTDNYFSGLHLLENTRRENFPLLPHSPAQRKICSIPHAQLLCGRGQLQVLGDFDITEMPLITQLLS